MIRQAFPVVSIASSHDHLMEPKKLFLRIVLVRVSFCNDSLMLEPIVEFRWKTKKSKYECSLLFEWLNRGFVWFLALL